MVSALCPQVSRAVVGCGARSATPCLSFGWKSSTTSRCNQQSRSVVALATPSPSTSWPQTPSSSSAPAGSLSSGKSNWTSVALESADDSSSTGTLQVRRRLMLANRLDQLMAAKMASKAAKRVWDMDKVAALGSAMMLAGLVTFGHNLVVKMCTLASVPVQDLDAVAYFLLCFNLVSAVTGRPTQDGP